MSSNDNGIFWNIRFINSRKWLCPISFDNILDCLDEQPWRSKLQLFVFQLPSTYNNAEDVWFELLKAE